MVRHRPHDHRARANLHEIADANVAEKCCSSSHHDFVSEGWGALPGVLASAAKGDSLIENHVVADFRGFADDDAHAVVDKKSAADARSGMNFDSGEAAGKLADHARDCVPARAI